MCASVFARAKTDTRCPHWKDPRYLRGAYIMNHKKLLLTLTLCPVSYTHLTLPTIYSV